MWGGPLDPSGSYTPITQYSDGTAIRQKDFTTKNYPENNPDKPLLYYMHGDVDYFNMALPPDSCTAVQLLSNSDVYISVDKHFPASMERPVVCQGTKYFYQFQAYCRPC